MQRSTRWLLGLIGSFFVVSVLFFNCAKPNSISAQDASTAAPTPAPSSTPTVSTVAALTAAVSPATVTSTGKAQINASGGVEPYSYQIIDGGGTVSSSGAVTGPFTSSSVNLEITDSAGASFNISLAVSGISTGTGASCTLGGVTIQDGSTIRTYTAATRNCSATAASCTDVGAFQDRLCTNGTLSGTFTVTSCSYAPCTYQISVIDACPNFTTPGAGEHGPSTNPSGSTLPSSCTSALYGSQYCVGTYSQGSGQIGPSTTYNQYECVSPGEVIPVVNDNPSSQPGHM